jgi:hypothetical protein
MSGTYGNQIAMASGTDEEVLVVGVDIDIVADVRRTQNYWRRNRQPETYGDLVSGHL